MGGKTSTTTQQVQIPKEVMDRYNAVNAQAQQVASNPFQVYSTDPSAFVAQLNQQQQAGINQINQAAGSYQPFFQGAASAVTAGMGSANPGALNTSQYMNPYQQSVIDATMKQMGQANEQAQSGALGTAISSGAFGGDRAGVAAANLANQQGMAMGSTLAGLNAQNYAQALAAAQQQQGVQLGADQANLARLLQGGQTLAGLGSAYQQAGLQGAEAMLNAGTLQQQTDQAGLSALYNQFQQQQAYPFQVAQFLANIAMGTGALSGSTTTTQQPVPFFSDRRLKTDIKRVGTADNGLPVYTFKYKGDDTEQTHVGYMADEVEKVHPEAVGVHPSGYKVVDYDRASRAQGGGVAGPYGAAVGSQPGLGGYVPQAYLPVGELMVADPQLIDLSKQSLASQMEAASNFGDNLTDLYDKYGSVKKKLDEWAAGRAAQNPFFGGGKAEGGLVTGAQNPVNTRTYLSDTLAAQDKEEHGGLKPPGEAPQPRSILGDIVDAGKMVMAVAGMNHGGVAGRHGYADGGFGALTPEQERAQRLREDLAKAMAVTGVAPAANDFRAPAADRPDFAQPQPAAGLAPASARRMAPVQEVADTSLTGLAPTKVPEIPPAQMNPTTFFDTRILKQESGNKQFDPRTGQPLTSSAGAIGIAQVMPGTAPEAAKLAGMEFDEQRYRTDPEYNAALGRAYFKHQFDTFGSVDKAAAAYNAGPGAVSSAIDRATALGGSYLDYLPAETQAYVRATTGVTGSGNRVADATGVAGNRAFLSTSNAPAEGSVGKAYADRNTLGKFFHDRDGSLNKDALLSLLSGLGTMASSPSLYLGSAVLQGIGGAANTYMAREQQRADIGAKNLENMRNVAMDTMTWNEMNGTNLTPAEYARANGIVLNIPDNISAQQILSGNAYQPTTGSGIDKLDYRTFQNGTVDLGGRQVRMQDDPASLQRFILDNSWASEDSPIGRAVAQARSQLARIEALGGVTVDAATGQQFVIPGYVAAGDTQSQAEQNRQSTAAFRETANDRLPEISKGLANIGKQAAIFTQLEAGALTNELTNFGAIASALGLPVPTGVEADRAYAEQALKLAADGTIQQLSGLPGTDRELGVLQSISANPNLQPEAVKTVLAVQKAGLLQEQDRYRLRAEWNKQNPGREMDQTAYEEWFSQTHPFEEYYDAAKKSMPTFKGEAPPVDAVGVELRSRGYVQKPDGSWEKP